jgi:hypothetical protein
LDQLLKKSVTLWFRLLRHGLVSRSFKLSRPLQGQEQLDTSVTREFETWFLNKD